MGSSGNNFNNFPNAQSFLGNPNASFTANNSAIGGPINQSVFYRTAFTGGVNNHNLRTSSDARFTEFGDYIMNHYAETKEEFSWESTEAMSLFAPAPAAAAITSNDFDSFFAKQ